MPQDSFELKNIYVDKDTIFNTERLDELHDVELRVLGNDFLEAERIKRQPISKISIPLMINDVALQNSTEIYLVTHREGVQIIEVWMDLSEQEFDSRKWIGWLKKDSKYGIINSIQNAVPYLKHSTHLYTFIGILGKDQKLEDFINRHGREIINLIYLDFSVIPFKSNFVEDELNKNFCLREGGASYISNSLALNVMFVNSRESPELDHLNLQGRCALPFIISIELLLLEKQILEKYYRKLTKGSLSINGLIGLKQEILDGLEEYYGIIARATQFSEPLMEYGQQILGINDLYDSVIDRLDAVTFDITTNYERNTNVLTFWLTILFGSLDIGLLTEGIASIYYVHNLMMILIWTVISTAVTSLGIYVLLYRRIK
jgi:hypothetical protein